VEERFEDRNRVLDGTPGGSCALIAVALQPTFLARRVSRVGLAPDDRTADDADTDVAIRAAPRDARDNPGDKSQTINLKAEILRNVQ